VLSVDIPGQGRLDLRHLVLDYNGTLALDGKLIPGVAERLNRLACGPYDLGVRVITADTFGLAREHLGVVDCECLIIGADNQDQAKLEFIQGLGPENVAAVGNGRNDRLMLGAAALGLAIIGEEGAAVPALLAAHVACPSILAALDLLLHPLRLAATLRL
jgi:soluble P-type ATPase